jgi:hypothetical protein
LHHVPRKRRKIKSTVRCSNCHEVIPVFSLNADQDMSYSVLFCMPNRTNRSEQRCSAPRTMLLPSPTLTCLPNSCGALDDVHEHKQAPEPRDTVRKRQKGTPKTKRPGWRRSTTRPELRHASEPVVTSTTCTLPVCPSPVLAPCNRYAKQSREQTILFMSDRVSISYRPCRTGPGVSYSLQ